MMISLLRKTSLLAAAFATMLSIPGCFPDLDPGVLTPPDLDVRVQFAGGYDNITIRLDGVLTAPLTGQIPSNVPTIDNLADEQANVFVEPTQEIAMRRQLDLHPGVWSVTVRATDSNGGEIFTYNCPDVNIRGVLLGENSIVSLKFVEGGVDCTTVDGSLGALSALHDIAVTSLDISPLPVVLGGTYLIEVGLQNNREESESGIVVTLEDTPPAAPAPVILGVATANTLDPVDEVGSSTTVTIPWDTSVNTVGGTHRLRARASVPGISETDNSNNEIRQDVVVQQHDAEAVTVSATAANVGQIIPVGVRVRNNGNVADDIQVSLAVEPPGAGMGVPIGSQVATVAAGAETVVTFDWDTACIGPPGSYVLTADVAVDYDSVPANDISPPASLPLAIDHELGIDIVLSSASVSRGNLEFFTYRLINNNSVAEPGVTVAFQDVTTGQQGTFQFAQTQPFDLACGEARELQFVWGPGSLASPGELHDLTLTISSTVAGDDPSDNTDFVTVTVQN